jgi:hypothetical protein
MKMPETLGWYSLEEKQGLTLYGSYKVVREYDLRLVNGKQQWQEYEQAKHDFYEWFKKEKGLLESIFHQTTGDAKIGAAKALLDFVLEAIIRWQEIKLPSSGTWEGDFNYRMSAVLSFPSVPAITVSGKMHGKVRLALYPPLSSSGPPRVLGELTDGKMEVDLPIPFMFSATKAFGQFRGDLAGQVDIDWIPGSPITAKGFLSFQTKKIDIAIAGPFGMVAGGTSHRVGSGGMKGRLFLRILGYPIQEKPLHISKEKTDFELPFKLFLQEQDEEIDFKKLLNEYYIQYVMTIDEVRTIQYQGLQEKQIELALETFELLLEALAFGQAIGIDSSAIAQTRLIPGSENSLFDKWFRLYINAGFKYGDSEFQKMAWEKVVVLVQMGILSEKLGNELGSTIHSPVG